MKKPKCEQNTEASNSKFQKAQRQQVIFRDTILIDFKRFSSECFGGHEFEESTWQDY